MSLMRFPNRNLKPRFPFQSFHSVYWFNFFFLSTVILIWMTNRAGEVTYKRHSNRLKLKIFLGSRCRVAKLFFGEILNLKLLKVIGNHRTKKEKLFSTIFAMFSLFKDVTNRRDPMWKVPIKVLELLRHVLTPLNSYDLICNTILPFSSYTFYWN